MDKRAALIQHSRRRLNGRLGRPMPEPQMRDWWADGSWIMAVSEASAQACFVGLYGTEASVIRPWTEADQAELDRVTA